jgi:16S rRNA (cytidine1402-2'-O)-methyltransferase
MTIRALKVLKQVRFIAAETPLTTQLLLSHHDITATITSYNARNCVEQTPVILHRLGQGQDVALVSDNGMPVIYDPGRLLVTAAHRSGIPVKVIPGPSAVTAAVALSGYSGDRLLFEGKLPKPGGQVLRFVRGLREEPRTVVLFVEVASVSFILEVLARTLPGRQVTLVIDLTTDKEVFLQGTSLSVLAQINRLPSDARITLVVEGKTKVRTRRRKKAERD